MTYRSVRNFIYSTYMSVLFIGGVVILTFVNSVNLELK